MIIQHFRAIFKPLDPDPDFEFDTLFLSGGKEVSITVLMTAC